MLILLFEESVASSSVQGTVDCRKLTLGVHDDVGIQNLVLAFHPLLETFAKKEKNSSWQRRAKTSIESQPQPIGMKMAYPPRTELTRQMSAPIYGERILP